MRVIRFMTCNALLPELVDLAAMAESRLDNVSECRCQHGANRRRQSQPRHDERGSKSRRRLRRDRAVGSIERC